MHLEYIKKYLGSFFYKRFINCFDEIYYTHKIHLRKPDKNIFEYVFTNSKLNPKECFFIDDTLENTKMAIELGVTCWTINPKKEDVIHLKEQLKLIF